MAENSPPTDLFGEPILPAKEKRGRPSHVRTVELSRKIALSRAVGRTIEQIKSLVGLDEKTLRKYYSRELEKAPELVEAVLDEAIFEQAMQGRVGAMRLMKEMLDRGKAAVPISAGKRSAPAAPKPKAKVEAPGKKAQANTDAISAHQGTSWAEALKPH